VRGGLATMYVGATLAVAREGRGMRFFAVLRMTGTRDVSKAPLLKGAERAIRESPLRVLSKQEGVIKGETRSCPLEIASARSAGRHVSTETCAIENPTTACVGTLRKHAGGMFLVPTAAAMPRGGNRDRKDRAMGDS
jgi:hypothetical protein